MAANIKDVEKSAFTTPGASSVDLEEYAIDDAQMLGRGNFAIVLKAKHRKSGNWVAIKVYEKYKMLDVQLK